VRMTNVRSYFARDVTSDDVFGNLLLSHTV